MRSGMGGRPWEWRHVASPLMFFFELVKQFLERVSLLDYFLFVALLKHLFAEPNEHSDIPAFGNLDLFLTESLFQPFSIFYQDLRKIAGNRIG